MADHTRKINDTLPPLDCTLNDADGAFDLSDYTVEFVMRSSANTVIAEETSSGNVTVLDSTAGRVRMNWDSSHLATPGNYLAEWEAADVSDDKLTFPNNGHIEIVLTPELST